MLRPPERRDLATDPSFLLFRHFIQERQRHLFRPGAHVVCLGAGDEALHLAGMGVFVRALVPSHPTAQEVAKRASDRDVAGEQLAITVGQSPDRVDDGGPYDGACVDLLAFPELDRVALGTVFRRVVRPGAPLLLTLGPPRRSAETKRQLGEGICWNRTSALGLLLPKPGHADWASRHPQTFGLLWAIEGLVRSWPILRSFGTLAVLEGTRLSSG